MHCQHSAGCMEAFLRSGGVRSPSSTCTNEFTSRVDLTPTWPEADHLQRSYPTWDESEGCDNATEEELESEEEEEEEEEDSEDQSDTPSLSTIDSRDTSVEDYFHQFSGNGGDDDSEFESEDAPVFRVPSCYQDSVPSSTNDVSMDLYNQRALFQSQNIEGMANSG